MKNKIYLVKVTKQSLNTDVQLLDANICDSLEQAILKGTSIIDNDCYNNSAKDLNTEDDILQYLKTIKELLDTNYKIRISIISGNRKRFNTSKELMDYFNNNIKNINNDNLYDFLLSLVESNDIVYDYSGNIVYKEIIEQTPMQESGYSCDIDFNEEDCKKGFYTFIYE